MSATRCLCQFTHRGTRELKGWWKLSETSSQLFARLIMSWTRIFPTHLCVQDDSAWSYSHVYSFVMTGRVVNLSVMLGMANPNNKVTASEYLNRLQTWLQVCFTEDQNSLKKFGEWWYYNLTSYGNSRKKQVSHKLMPNWKGPYMVVKCFWTVYKIMTSFKVTKLYHFHLLKPCNATDIPWWIVRAKKHFVQGDSSVGADMKQKEPRCSVLAESMKIDVYRFGGMQISKQLAKHLIQAVLPLQNGGNHYFNGPILDFQSKLHWGLHGW